MSELTGGGFPVSRLPHSSVSRRVVLAAGASALVTPATGQTNCDYGPQNHVRKGPPVWLDLDQAQLDAAYDQDDYQPHTEEVNSRLSALSYALRERRGYPERAVYGDHPKEGMDIYRADATNAPVFVFIHGGIWRFLDAARSGFAAEPFLESGAHFVALDFADVTTLDNDLARLADQVCRGIAWVVQNAESFGGDPSRVYIGGHSSGGHLAAVAIATDWREFGLSADAIKGALCMSGMYDMAPVRLSWRSSFFSFTDQMEQATSPLRHLDRINVPVTITYGSLETPEFQRQAEEFAGALKAAGKPVRLEKGLYYFHQDMWETLGNPYGVNGRAALELMGLHPAR
jgi:arylformamidase